MDLYSITFNSAGIPADAATSAKARLGALFKLSEKQLEQLFSGVTVVVRRNLPLERAKHYQAAFAKAGAPCRLLRESKDASPPNRINAGRAAPTPAPTRDAPALTVENLASYFTAAIPRVRISLRYRFSLIGVSVLMALLPLLYFGLITAVVAAGFWHATRHFDALWGKGALPFALLYVGPIVVALILGVALLKPIFARRAESTGRTRLTRKDEPLFFALVEKVCALVGAPMPQWVEVDSAVNASARLLPGWRGLIRNQLVLCVGMPLFAGLDTRQLAGILAHEFGHFSQGAGMRATALIYGVNGWLYRCAYRRDRWDDLLVKWSRGNDAIVVIPIAVARGAVWLTRKLVSGLMWIGIAVSHLLSREMEIDADRYEAHIAGSEQFRKTAFRLRLLNVAFNAVYDELNDSWRHRQLVDNLPDLIAHRAKELEPEVAKQIIADLQEAQTDLFDTHPADGDRIESAERLNAVAAFRYVAPARYLLRNYDALAKRSTWHFYRAVLGLAIKDHQLVPMAQIHTVVANERAALDALGSYFHGFFERHHFMQPLELAAATELPPAQRQARLNECVTKVRGAKPDITRVIAQLDKVKRETIDAYGRLAIAQYMDDAAIGAIYQRLCERLAATERELKPLEGIFRERLALGLAEAAARAPEIASEMAQLIAAHNALSRIHNHYLASYREGAALYYIADLRAQDAEIPDHTLRAQHQKLKNDVTRLESELSTVAYPFSRATGEATAYAHLAEGLPRHLRDAAPRDYLDYSAALLEAVARFHMQVVGRLAALAAESEARLGIRVKLL